MRQARQEATLRRWFDALPGELFQVRPVLAVGYVGALMATGELNGVETLLLAAERWLEPPGHREPPDASSAAMVVMDDAEFERLPGTIAMYRAALAHLHGDVAGTLAHAGRVLALVPEDDHLGRGAASALIGLSYWSTGDLDAGYRWYADGQTSLEKADHLSDVVGGAITLADLRMSQGRLNDALRLYERGWRVATSQGGPPLRGAADMQVGMSELFRERNDLETASRHLLISRELGDENGLPQNRYRSRVATARIRQAQGDLDGSLDLLSEAARLYAGDFSPDVRPVAALRARVWIAKRSLPEAWGWVREVGITAADELSYVRAFEHATLARLLLAQGTHDLEPQTIEQSIDLTVRLLAAAEHGGATGNVIDVLVVQAVARHASGDPEGALATLDRAVALAEPEGYVRVFADEGSPMGAVLKRAAKRPNASSYVRRLLAAVVTSEGRPPELQPLIEPLSEREFEVLRLLESDLDGPDMARELTVSLATFRTHTRNVYAKLGVNSRRAAVRRAAELGLLSRPRERRPSA